MQADLGVTRGRPSCFRARTQVSDLIPGVPARKPGEGSRRFSRPLTHIHAVDVDGRGMTGASYIILGDIAQLAHNGRLPSAAPAPTLLLGNTLRIMQDLCQTARLSKLRVTLLAKEIAHGRIKTLISFLVEQARRFRIGDRVRRLTGPVPIGRRFGTDRKHGCRRSAPGFRLCAHRPRRTGEMGSGP